MKFAFILIFTFLISFCFALSNIEKALSQLDYARFCADSLHDNSRALNSYNDLLLLLQEDSYDSLRLVSETERIALLKKIGKRTELLKSLGSAIILAEKHKNYEQLSYLLNVKSFVYIQLGFKEEAINVLEEAHKSAVSIQDRDHRNVYLGYYSAALSYIADKSEEKAIYFTKAYQYFMDISSTSSKYRNAQILGNSYYASAFIEEGQLDSAMHYLKISTSFLDPKNALPDDYFAILNFARLYYIKEDYVNAKKWFMYALQQAKSENNSYRQSIIYLNLYNVELVLGKDIQANIYLQHYVSLKEELDEIQKQSINLVANELVRKRDQTMADVSQQQKGIIIIFIIITFLFCVIVWFFMRKEEKSSIQTLNLEDILRLIGEYVSFQNKSSIQKDSNFTKVYPDFNAPKTNMLPKEPPEQENKEVTVEQINELNHLVKTNDSSFMVKFHEVFPTFVKTINESACPPLNNSEIEICACTKLNFTTKDIALYRNYSLRSVENRKYRIRKKLMLAPEVDFIVWIASLK